MGRPNLKFLFLSFGIFGFLFFHLAQQMLQVRPDGWYVGQVNLYGDLVFHLGFINKFLQSKSILVGSPIYAGEKPNYPLFADFITAQIAKLTGVDFALFITTFLMGLVVIFTIRLFIFNFIKNEKIVFFTTKRISVCFPNYANRFKPPLCRLAEKEKIFFCSCRFTGRVTTASSGSFSLFTFYFIYLFRNHNYYYFKR